MGRTNDRDLALQTLMLALTDGAVEPPAAGRVAFLRARPHDALRQFGERLVCEQDFKPDAAALEAAGFGNAEGLDGKFSLVLLLPDRQKQQTLGDLARGMDLLEDGGVLLVSLHNKWGARRFEDHLGELAGEVGKLSKHHCRVFWAHKTPALNLDLLGAWRALSATRKIIEGRFWSRPGLFSWDEIDPGSRLLTGHLPANLRGRVADFGAGWGFLADYLLRNRKGIKSLDLFEADRIALDCARRNLEEVQAPAALEFHWADATQDAGERKYDYVVMNAPFHEGRQMDPLLGMNFIAAAARALKPGGELWMVAGRQLPYERLMSELFVASGIAVDNGAFKVLHGRKATRDEEAAIRESGALQTRP